jgi:hypothetical protein
MGKTSACHAGLDPASRIVMGRKRTGFRIKPGMTTQKQLGRLKLQHTLGGGNPETFVGSTIYPAPDCSVKY